jgi:hypothetical protein
MNKDDNNNDNKKKQADDILSIIGSMQKREPKRLLEEDDILGVARAVQQPNMKHQFPIPSQDKSNLRKFLNQLDKDPDIDADYKNSPIYQMGVADTMEIAHELAEQRHVQDLRALRTMIDAMINSK